jgi:drug/metabolite transporter (DMT)-like permease
LIDAIVKIGSISAAGAPIGLGFREADMALRDWLLLILLGTIWGGSFLFNAVLIRELGPFWVSALRVSIGAAGCWVFLLATRRRLPESPGTYLGLLLLGVISYAVPFSLFPLAQAHMAAGLAAILNALTPITTVIVSQFWPGGEKATKLKLLGVVAGFIGVAILTAPALAAGGQSQLWAIGACLGATACYAVALNYTRSFAGLDPITLATLSLTGAAVFAVPVAFLTEGAPVLTTAESFGAAAGIGLISTTFAYLLMYPVLRRIGGTNFSTVTFIAPISAVILGVLFLGEHVEAAHLWGMLGIFIGLLLIDGRIVRRLRRGITRTAG